MKFKYKGIFVFILLFFFLIFFSVPDFALADDFSPARIREISRSVKLLVTEGNGSRIGQGTGFFVSPDGHMLTNYHVVEGNKAVKIWDDNKLYDVTRIVAFDRDADIALLETNYPRSSVHHLSLRKSVIELGEPVMVLGYPKAFQLGDSITVTKGSVSSLRQAGDDTLIQFTAFVAGGSSGSPVIDKNGEAAGIVTSELTLGQGMFLGLSSPSIFRYVGAHIQSPVDRAVLDLPSKPLILPVTMPVQQSARNEASLIREILVIEVQILLNELGYNAGAEDGIAGPLTSSAVRAFQRSRGVRVNGVVSDELLKMLRDEKNRRYAARADAVATDLQALIDNAMRGSVDAQRELGLLYREGRNVPADYTKAAGWLQIAGMHGDPVAQTELAHMHRHGIGVHRNYPAAIMWLHRAGEQGYAPAQTMLGEMYMAGLGVAHDRIRAFEWYRLAAMQGYVPAIEALNSLLGM